ncbi:MAG: type II toxin-antitoxin system HicA family toxin [Chloroflexi bacterium]|nr:type II toxin-antitoxin system HicA family toxin [Chloroflexota bacterium]
MPRLKRLSGAEVIGILESFDFHVISQRGSHVKLRRISPDGENQTLTIPRHRQLDVGTLQAIVRQASRFVSQESLRSIFYPD